MSRRDDKDEKDSTFGLLLWMQVSAVGAALTIIGYADSKGATEALEKSGYTQIDISGREAKSQLCKGFYRTRFNAVAPDGTAVTGVVCQPLGGKREIVALPQPAPRQP